MTEKGLSTLEQRGDTEPTGVKWRRETVRKAPDRGIPEVNSFVLLTYPLKMTQDHQLKGSPTLQNPTNTVFSSCSTPQELTTEMITPFCFKHVLLVGIFWPPPP